MTNDEKANRRAFSFSSFVLHHSLVLRHSVIHHFIAMSVLVVGSIALDTVKTPVEEHADLLGGSASYAAVGASFFTGVNLVGVVGGDFPKAHVEYFGTRKIDLDGLQIAQGKTFRWSGE